MTEKGGQTEFVEFWYIDGMLVVRAGGIVVVEVLPVVVAAQLVTTTGAMLVTLASVTGTGTPVPGLVGWPV